MADPILGTSVDDALVGTEADDFIRGLGGNDFLAGRGGKDTLEGGGGIDTADYAAASGPVTVNLAAGTASGADGSDTLLTIENVWGSDFADTILGDALANLLDGGAGGDVLRGGAGDDTYLVDNADDLVTENASAGVDTVRSSVNLILRANLENLTLLGGAVKGTGNSLSNTITGNDQGNVIDGLGGADIMEGGRGNDSYFIDSKGDSVVETATGGYDRVQSTVSTILSANVEQLVLIGAKAFNGTGNDSTNIIAGNDLDNVIDGGAGADSLRGGAGEDTYIVDHKRDKIVELAGNGTDTVRASVSYNLGDNVENLTLVGTSAIKATGNALDNHLVGNGGANVLDGGAGADIMEGGEGGDIYIVDSLSDTVTDTGKSGADMVKASISYTLSARLENLTLTGSANIDATGNSAINHIFGNDGDNVLDGKGGGNGVRGSELLAGGDGNDTYIYDSAYTVIIEKADAGIDTIRTTISAGTAAKVENLVLLGTHNISGFGNDGINVITGNSGNNYIDGGDGADTLIGGAGDDRFVTNGQDTLVEEVGGGSDTVIATLLDTEDFHLAVNFENLTILTGRNGYGNEVDNIIAGNRSDNVLDGGAGADTMYGGGGDDTYYVDNLGDVVDESTGAYSDVDTVISSVDYTMADRVDNLTLTGAARHGTGNSMNNIITGTGGADTLDGKGGVDKLAGGAGDDTYVLDSTPDKVIELANGGIDTVMTVDGNYILAENLENLVLMESAASGTGNAADNTITGNAANNTINGKAGADLMIGGEGNDTYLIDNLGDRVVENENEGHDLITSSVDFALGSGVEDLTLVGTADLKGMGNSLDNKIVGNGFDNTLDGGAGDDKLTGANGDDILIGGGGNDVLDGGGGKDTMTGGTGDDVYSVSSKTDVIMENVGEGHDLVAAQFSYKLGANLEDLTLDGFENLNATGNELDNTIKGNAGANVLDGGAGADHLIGDHGGLDTYIVDNAGDTVEGSGLVKASVSFTLSGDSQRLELAGNAAINGTGTDFIDTITGNSAANVLDGKGGHDTLDGGAGADRMIGGTGADKFFVDNVGDVVVETGVDLDTVITKVDFVLGSGLEILSAVSGADIGPNGQIKFSTTNLKLTGNEGDNFIWGNDGANQIDGKGGNDVIFTSGGDDTVLGGGGDDTIVRGLGSKTVTGGAGADTFVVGLFQPGTSGSMKVTDFTNGVDRVVIISEGLFNFPAFGTPPESAIAEGTSAKDADDRIIYDQASGNLWLDVDGTGATAQQLVANFGAGHAADITDVVLTPGQQFFSPYNDYFNEIFT